jgi:hypothetical protein
MALTPRQGRAGGMALRLLVVPCLDVGGSYSHVRSCAGSGSAFNRCRCNRNENAAVKARAGAVGRAWVTQACKTRSSRGSRVTLARCRSRRGCRWCGRCVPAPRPWCDRAGTAALGSLKEALMRWPIVRPGGTVLVLAAVLLSLQAAHVSAGVVSPSDGDPPRPTDASSPTPGAVIASALPLPGVSEPQPFWYPGVDPVVSVSSVPVAAASAPAIALPGDQQPPVIPLPGAAWTGLAGLAGLGGVKLVRNLRKLLA